MEWEHCVRCNSNRVIRQQTIFFPLALIFAGILWFGVGNVSFEESLSGAIFLWIIGVTAIIFGGKWMTKSKRLFCKDCELKWKPKT